MSKVLHPKYDGFELTVYENTNNSTSKQKFSFPKSDRFSGHKAPLNERISYDLPSTLIERAISFGIGERSGRKDEATVSKLLHFLWTLRLPFAHDLPAEARL